jgi:hypothetical protein
MAILQSLRQLHAILRQTENPDDRSYALTFLAVPYREALEISSVFLQN